MLPMRPGGSERLSDGEEPAISMNVILNQERTKDSFVERTEHFNAVFDGTTGTSMSGAWPIGAELIQNDKKKDCHTSVSVFCAERKNVQIKRVLLVIRDCPCLSFSLVGT